MNLRLLTFISLVAVASAENRQIGEYRRHAICTPTGDQQDWFIPEHGKPIKLKLPKHWQLNSGQKYLLKLGKKTVDGEIVLQADGLSESPGSAMAVSCSNRTLLVVPVNTSDYTHPSSIGATLWEIAFGDSQSVRAAYFDQAGFVFSGTVAAPVTISMTADETCGGYYGTATPLVNAQLEAAGVVHTNYNHVCYVFPPASCGFKGAGQWPGRLSWVWGTSYPVVFVHELGHNLGQGHSGSDADFNGVTEDVYGDLSCYMGRASAGYRLANGRQRGLMGWQLFDDWDCLPTAAVTNTLLDLNNGGRPARILWGPTLSYRRVTSKDPVGTAFTNGVEVHGSAGRVGNIPSGWTMRLGSNLRWDIQCVSLNTTSATVIVTTTECDPPWSQPPQLIPPSSSGSVIVNNEDANMAWIPNLAGWTLVLGKPAAWNNDLRYVNKEGYGADFLPAVPEAGDYEVFVWYNSHSNRGTNVLARIWSPNQSATPTDIRFNQQINGSQWFSLGTYSFDSGQQKVGLRAVGVTGGSKYVIADAIKLEKRP